MEIIEKFANKSKDKLEKLLHVSMKDGVIKTQFVFSNNKEFSKVSNILLDFAKSCKQYNLKDVFDEALAENNIDSVHNSCITPITALKVINDCINLVDDTTIKA